MDGVQEQADLVMRAARLSETSRQHLLAAWEVCAKEAASRPKKATDILGAFRLGEGGEKSPDSE